MKEIFYRLLLAILFLIVWFGPFVFLGYMGGVEILQGAWLLIGWIVGIYTISGTKYL